MEVGINAAFNETLNEMAYLHNGWMAGAGECRGQLILEVGWAIVPGPFQSYLNMQRASR